MTYIHNQILPVGTQIGVYEIKDVSKVGTFDIVYRAWNHHLKEWVKIQEYFPHDFAIRANDGLGVEFKSAGDKENYAYGLKAFLDQAEILTQIEHPNIVITENVLQLNGTAYLILGVPKKGVSLLKLIQAPTTFDETELKFILVSILTALQKIHEHSIVHGGIQPAAIILGKDGEPLLTNFSAARLTIAARTAQLADELVAGYAAMEQYEPAKKSGPATDFYALGATMYYCMTHQQPVVVQSRAMLLSKSEPDPMVLLSGTTDASYSAELLRAVNWMLQPEYNHRPQSAAEIITLLKSDSASDQASALTPEQATANNKSTLWVGVMAGIVALVVFGLWFNEKPAEIVADKSGIVTTQPLFQRNPGKSAAAIESETQEQQSVASVTAEPNQASNVDQISETIQETTHVAEQKADSVTTPPIIEPAFKDKTTIESEPDSGQQLARIDQSLTQSKQPSFSEKQTDGGSISKHLAAAEKAMKAGRLTTPLRDNAHKYYQTVLAMEADNVQALTGLQKIVDRYAQFIGKARAEGRLNDAKLYLQRAEAVLPDDPKLKSIRAGLGNAE
ncbi:serine/threonine protein kinase [Nitrosomonas sp. Nm84]|uniref:serine/threonine protein kinase n=1 Tax=Nitrosomonas sp. Nm84 TaxID=200124 RepID=UPI000D7747D5|nr:protein kinase [Nitrosomonas sp. Nm84]PXW80366.1 serine/threonine protein kinase [Nitrosomonas sp. Nm84]